MSDILSSDLPLPSWRKSLEKSLEMHRHQVQSIYMQLASCSIDGQPKVRTVVFRGFVEHRNFLTIHTDIRSEKCTQYAENSSCEICWYFTESREQFRIAGKVIQVNHESSEFAELRLAHWQQLSLAAKADYSKTIPGIPLPTKTPLTADSENLTAQQMAKPHNNFVLLLVQPSSIDHVMLLPSPHERVMHNCDENGVWHSRAITP